MEDAGSADRDGAVLRWAQGSGTPQRAGGIEKRNVGHRLGRGTGSVLSQQLLAAREKVLDVPATLALET